MSRLDPSPLAPPTDLTAAEQRFWAPARARGRFANAWGVNPRPRWRDAVEWVAGRNPWKAEKRAASPPGVAEDALTGFSKLPTGARTLWLGHASLLFEMDGLTVLTDPIFGRIGGVHPRATPRPVEVDALPALDVVLISHGHRDHLDLRSVRALHDRFGDALTWLVPLGIRRYLPRSLIRVAEFDWWHGLRVGPLRFVFVPAQHWHLRGLADLNAALWGGWVVEGQRRAYFSGDTGYFDGFGLMGRVFGGFDLAALPLGAWAPRSIMSAQHMDPAESLDAFVALRARHFLGMHWGTYDLSWEPLDGGAHALPELIAERGIDPAAVHVVAPGGSLSFGDAVVAHGRHPA